MNRKSEIIVLPVEDNQKRTFQEGMAVFGLSDISIEKIKEDRLKKYEGNI